MNAFKPITENPIILDFTGCRSLGEVHLILRQAFGLPESYGENWDALWDCLRYLFIGQEDQAVNILGLSSLPCDLREECQSMLDVFKDVRAAAPEFSYQVVS